MKAYIAYFYQIRYFEKNHIPISTAKWDQKWFHDGKGPKNIFIDRRGVINGIRMERLSPGPNCDGLCGGAAQCSFTPDGCSFLRGYRKWIEAIDFPTFRKDLSLLLESTGISNPVPVFMVYETPDNPCSERHVLKEWLNKNGIECEDYPILQNKK